MKNKEKKVLKEIKFYLSGSHLHILLKDEEKLLSLADLIDDFKIDMNDLKKRDDTSIESITYMEKKCIDELGRLHAYAKKQLNFEDNKLNRIIH